jgi:hypothetical protein
MLKRDRCMDNLPTWAVTIAAMAVSRLVATRRGNHRSKIGVASMCFSAPRCRAGGSEVFHDMLESEMPCELTIVGVPVLSQGAASTSA